MPSCLRERLYQERANLLGQRGHLRIVQTLEVGGRVNRLQQTIHSLFFSGKSTGLQWNTGGAETGPSTGTFSADPCQFTVYAAFNSRTAVSASGGCVRDDWADALLPAAAVQFRPFRVECRRVTLLH